MRKKQLILELLCDEFGANVAESVPEPASLSAALGAASPVEHVDLITDDEIAQITPKRTRIDFNIDITPAKKICFVPEHVTPPQHIYNSPDINKNPHSTPISTLYFDNKLYFTQSPVEHVPPPHKPPCLVDIRDKAPCETNIPWASYFVYPVM
ncbi:hypothetical protein CBL_20802 [Carabus blaptoides fortunei]